MNKLAWYVALAEFFLTGVSIICVILAPTTLFKILFSFDASFTIMLGIFIIMMYKDE